MTSRVPPATARELARLAHKYATLARLRRERAAGGDVAPREELRALAAEFPGALRELDLLPIAVIDARLEALARLAGEGPEREREPWVDLVAAYHRELRRNLGRAREPDAGQPRTASRRVIAALAAASGLAELELEAHLVGLVRRRGPK